MGPKAPKTTEQNPWVQFQSLHISQQYLSSYLGYVQPYAALRLELHLALPQLSSTARRPRSYYIGCQGQKGKRFGPNFVLGLVMIPFRQGWPRILKNGRSGFHQLEAPRTRSDRGQWVVIS